MDSKGTVTRAELDAAIQSAADQATRTQRGIREAERAVAPYVGTLAMSFDSAGAVYAHALKLKGVDTKGIHPSAFPALLRLCEKAGEKRASGEKRMATDSKRAQTFFELYPDAKRIRIS